MLLFLYADRLLGLCDCTREQLATMTAVNISTLSSLVMSVSPCSSCRLQLWLHHPVGSSLCPAAASVLPDAGKSTLSGNILYLSGEVDKRIIDKFEKEAKVRCLK